MRSRPFITDALSRPVCYNCFGTAPTFINDLCPHCHDFITKYNRHRPVFRPATLADWKEYLDGISHELMLMAKETKADKDLTRMVSAARDAARNASEAMNDRIKDGRCF